MICKQIEQSDSYLFVNRTVHNPIHVDTTTIYPVADFDPQTPPETFHFAAPTAAKEVTSLGMDYMLPATAQVSQMVGRPAPQVTFTTADGKKDLKSYRGQPLLIDFWATWCSPCLLSMPSFACIYAESKDKGLRRHLS